VKIVYKYGFPLVNSANIFAVLKSLKLKNWRQVGKPVILNDFLKNKKTILGRDFLKFVPRNEVVSFRSPEDDIFRGVRRTTADGVVVFTLLPGNLVPICAEFKHGIGQISLNLPGGANFSGENPSIQAKKEFKQETGIILKKLINLSPAGISNDARACKDRVFYFLGKPVMPLKIADKDLDKNEFLEALLIPLAEWIKLISSNKVLDGQSIVATFLALKKNKYF